MRVLGLDLGTKTGWAILDAEGNRYGSGVWDFHGRRFEGGGMRFLRFRQQLEVVLPGVCLVAFEEVRRHMGVDAAHVYGGLMATLTAACEQMQIPYTGIPVGTVKKAATGKGNAKKPAMIDAAKLRFRHDPEDDNEADALFIADCGRTNLVAEKSSAA